MEIKVRTQSEAWVETIDAIMFDGAVVSPRGLRCKELRTPWTVVIEEPGAGFVAASGRRLNHAITAVEATSLVGQISVPEVLIQKVGAFATYANDGMLWGAYGPRAQGDLGLIVKLLGEDPDSRQGVVTLYDSDRDLGRDGIKDVPCTLAIQFTIRDGRLNMWVTMRSNDAWLGLPYDLGQFSILQFAMAQALSVGVGTYTHSAGSMHLYEKNWDAARDVSKPTSVRLGTIFGGHDFSSIASRCRRMLIGQTVPSLTSLEAWLVEQMA